MKFLVLLFIVFSFTARASECLYQTQERLCIQLQWIDGPFLDAYSKNKVTFQSIDTKEFKTPSVPVKFYAWMKMGSHQHGSKPIQTTLTQEGMFENTNIFFMGGMMGTWELKVKVGEEDIVLFTLRT